MPISPIDLDVYFVLNDRDVDGPSQDDTLCQYCATFTLKSFENITFNLRSLVCSVLLLRLVCFLPAFFTKTGNMRNVVNAVFSLHDILHAFLIAKETTNTMMFQRRFIDFLCNRTARTSSNTCALPVAVEFLLVAKFEDKLFTTLRKCANTNIRQIKSFDFHLT